SSRRRHTRFSRDWSSDVCSSDLSTPPMIFMETGRTVASDVGLHVIFFIEIIHESSEIRAVGIFPGTSTVVSKLQGSLVQVGERGQHILIPRSANRLT